MRSAEGRPQRGDRVGALAYADQLLALDPAATALQRLREQIAR